jgi:hypothetical protein
MDAPSRMQLIRIIEKMEKNPEFSKKLGIRNKSVLKPGKEQKQKEKWL